MAHGFVTGLGKADASLGQRRRRVSPITALTPGILPVRKVRKIQHLLNSLHELRAVGGFEQFDVGSVILRKVQLVRRPSRYGNHRDADPCLPKFLDEPKAVEIGHGEIRHNQLHVLSPAELQRGLTIFRKKKIVSSPFQDGPCQNALHLFVVYNEDSCQMVLHSHVSGGRIAF